MKEYQVNHITSLPHYSQSNGLAEKYVQIIKNLFYKAKEEGQDVHKSLMIYRNTPLSSHLQSPMQILSSRSTRSTLPLSNVAERQMGIQGEGLRSKQKINISLHMICAYTRLLCFKNQQAKNGIQQQ